MGPRCRHVLRGLIRGSILRVPRVHPKLGASSWALGVPSSFAPIIGHFTPPQPMLTPTHPCFRHFIPTYHYFTLITPLTFQFFPPLTRHFTHLPSQSCNITLFGLSDIQTLFSHFSPFFTLFCYRRSFFTQSNIYHYRGYLPFQGVLFAIPGGNICYTRGIYIIPGGNIQHIGG